MAETAFATYAWMCSKRFGSEIYSTWRKELFSSVTVTIIAGVIGYWLNDASWWPTLETALLANGLLLFGFGIYHFVRTAWLIHNDTISGSTEPLAGKFGIVGVVSLALLMAVIVCGVWLLRRTQPVAVRAPVPDTSTADAEQIAQLTRELDVARKKKCPAPTTAGPAATQSPQPAPAQAPDAAPIFSMEYANPQTKNVMDGLNAFLYLQPQLPPALGERGKGCWVRITSPRENNTVWIVLHNLAQIARCNVDGRPGDDLKPEIEAAALEGAVKDAVILHAPNEMRYNNAAIFLSKFLKVKRVYDTWNEGKADQEVWIQVGPGIPYKEHNDPATTIK